MPEIIIGRVALIVLDHSGNGSEIRCTQTILVVPLMFNAQRDPLLVISYTPTGIFDSHDLNLLKPRASPYGGSGATIV